jgi:tripartite-type tricarboxylate transporter receptor subunit TctC
MTRLPRRALAALPFAALAAPASAQGEFPRQPIRMIVPFAAGTGSDTAARIVAHEARTRLPQPLLVENRPGGGGITGTEQGARAAPDGYTLTIGTTSTWITNPALNPRATYAFERDFAPVTLFGRSFYAVVTANTPTAPRTLAELLERLRTRPAEANFASSGAGTITHLTSEAILHRTGARATHVSYRGSAPAMTDIASGQVLFGSDTLIATVPLIRAGQLRALAVTSPERSAVLPEVPTLGESGLPGLVLDAWFGVAAPVATPAPILGVLAEAITGAVRSPEALARFEPLGIHPLGLGPEPFAAFVRENGAFWRRFIQESGLRVDFS